MHYIRRITIFHVPRSIFVLDIATAREMLRYCGEREMQTIAHPLMCDRTVEGFLETHDLAFYRKSRGRKQFSFVIIISISSIYRSLPFLKDKNFKNNGKDFYIIF